MVGKRLPSTVLLPKWLEWQGVGQAQPKKQALRPLDLKWSCGASGTQSDAVQDAGGLPHCTGPLPQCPGFQISTTRKSSSGLRSVTTILANLNQFLHGHINRATAVARGESDLSMKAPVAFFPRDLKEMDW